MNIIGYVDSGSVVDMVAFSGNRSACGCIAALLALCAAEGHAQTATKSDASAAITVIGKKQTPEEIRREAFDFVRTMGVANGSQQVARWIEPICPHVTGVDKMVADRVKTIVRKVALNAGARVDDEDCESNIVIAFTPDGGNLMQKMVDLKQRRLASVSPQDRNDLISGDAPVRWWYTTVVRSRDGMSETSVISPSVGVESDSGVSTLPENPSLNHYNSSVISTSEVRALTSATIVIDVTRAEGKNLDAVAGYAAMVALAEIKMNAKPTQSVLSLFEPNGFAELTGRDSDFLKALYQVRLDRPARQQRNLIVRSMIVGAPTKNDAATK